MLPMILGFLGSAFAPAIGAATGIAALASPLIAGSIGAGLGSTIQTGDIGEGIKTGLGSFFGGKLLGGLMGSTAGGALSQPLAGQTTIGSGAGAMTAGTPLTSAIMPPVPTAASPFSATGIKGALGSGLQFAQTPTGIGALIGTSLAAPTPTFETPAIEQGPEPEEMKPIPRQMQEVPAGYRPGIDPEFNYGMASPYSYGQLVDYRDRGVLPYAKGGELELDEDTGEFKVETERPVRANEKTEIVDAIAAIKGQHPQPEIALGKFLAKYGEDALRDLVDSVQSGEFDDTRERFANGENGEVRGPGDGSGVDDKVPATIGGEQDVLLADGEFVLRKDATDSLEKMYGGGFLSAVNKAGDRAAEVLKKKVAA